MPDARSVEQDFIVGGLVFTSDTAAERTISLVRSLPAPQGEVKSKAVLDGSKDKAKTLGRKEVSRYLDVLDDADTFVHYSAQNNLYFAIADIVDSLLHFDINRSFVNMHRELKDALFNVLRGDPKGSLDSLSRYGFPNVVGQDVGHFCRYLRDEVASGLTEELACEDSGAWFAAETLRQMLKAAEKEGQLFFLEGKVAVGLREDAVQRLPEVGQHIVDGHYQAHEGACVHALGTPSVVRGEAI